jgi:hypothetical protein
MEAVDLAFGRLDLACSFGDERLGGARDGYEENHCSIQSQAFLESGAGGSQRVRFQEGCALDSVLGKSPLEYREVFDDQTTFFREK